MLDSVEWGKGVFGVSCVAASFRGEPDSLTMAAKARQTTGIPSGHSLLRVSGMSWPGHDLSLSGRRGRLLGPPVKH